MKKKNIITLVEYDALVAESPRGITCACCEQFKAVKWQGQFAGLYIAFCAKCLMQFKSGKTATAQTTGFTQCVVDIFRKHWIQFGKQLDKEEKRVMKLQRKYGKNWLKAAQA